MARMTAIRLPKPARTWAAKFLREKSSKPDWRERSHPRRPDDPQCKILKTLATSHIFMVQTGHAPLALFTLGRAFFAQAQAERDANEADIESGLRVPPHGIGRTASGYRRDTASGT